MSSASIFGRSTNQPELLDIHHELIAVSQSGIGGSIVWVGLDSTLKRSFSACHRVRSSLIPKKATFEISVIHFLWCAKILSGGFQRNVTMSEPCFRFSFLKLADFKGIFTG
jgi:hypothetical protein